MSRQGRCEGLPSLVVEPRSSNTHFVVLTYVRRLNITPSARREWSGLIVMGIRWP
jgi:hypothetical protein